MNKIMPHILLKLIMSSLYGDIGTLFNFQEFRQNVYESI